MSYRRPAASCIACLVVAACSLAAAPANASPAQAGYLGCLARERAAPVRAGDAVAALLRLERYAICYRLHRPAADIPVARDGATCAEGVRGRRRAAHALRALERQRVQLGDAMALAVAASAEVGTLATVLTGEDAAHAARVARDLQAQAEALRLHAEALAAEQARREAACPAVATPTP